MYGAIFFLRLYDVSNDPLIELLCSRWKAL